MANTVYDQEDKKDQIPKPGSHDDLDDMTPDERRAQIEKLENDFAAPSAEDSDSLSSDEIEDAETKADDSGSDDQVGRGYNPKDKARSRLAIRSMIAAGGTRNRWLLGGGLGAVIAGLIVAAFLSLLPLKILHLVENLQNKFFATSENAVSKESEIMLSNYIKKYVVPSLSHCSGSTIDKNCNTIVGNGNNPVKNLYRAWSQAKLENTMADKYGIEIKRTSGIYYIKTPNLPDSDPNDPNLSKNGEKIDGFLKDSNADLFTQMKRNDIRNEVSNAFSKESKWKQVMYRFKVGRMLEQKYGIKRCIIACKVKDNFADWKDNKKLAAKSLIAERVLEPHAEILGIVLQCVLSGDGCKNIASGAGDGFNGEKQNEFQKKMQAKLDTIAEKYGQEAVANIIKDAQTLSDEGFTKYAVQKVVETVFNQFADEEAAQTAANAAGDVIPVVGAINTAASVINTVKSASKNIKYMAYAANAAAMVQLYMVYRTHADEIKSGHVDPELVGSFTDALGEQQQAGASAESTPLYSAVMDNGSTGSTALLDNFFPSAAAATTDNKGYTCDNKQGVPAGKLICPEEDLRQQNFFTGISDVFDKPPLSVVADIAAVWGKTAGKLISFVGNTIGDIISQFPGIKQLGEKVGDIVQPLLEAVVTYIIPSPMSDKMSGGRTFDMMAGGADVAGNDFAHHGLGGRQLSGQEAAAIMSEQDQQAQQEFSKSSFFAKMFDKNSNYSVVSKIAMAMPTNLNSALSTSFASLLHNPFSTLVNGFASMLSFGHTRASAAADMCSNGGPFGITCYGYSDTDINNIGDPEAYWDQHCVDSKFTDAWNNAATSNQNPDTAQYENNTTDPCLLIQSTVGSAGGYFSSSTLTSDDLTDSVAGGTAASTQSSGNVYMIGDSLTEGMKTSGNLAQQLTSAGYNVNQIESTVGINVANSIPKLQQDSAQVSTAGKIVVELGTNNCSLSGTPTCMSTVDFETQIANMITAIRSINQSAQIYWVNVYSTKGTAILSIDQAIDNQSSKLNYTVIDWAHEAASNPGQYSFDSALGVHQTSGTGYTNMAKFVVGSLK